MVHDDDDLLTPDDVAKKLAIRRKRVYRLVKSGDLPYFKIGRDIRIRSEDLEKWLESHRG